MATVQLYTPTIPTATSYQLIRATALVHAIAQRRLEWSNVDPTLSTKIIVEAMFEEIADILQDMGLPAAEIFDTRSHTCHLR